MNDELKAQVLAEVLEFGSAPPPQPGDFTLGDYIKAWQEKYEQRLPSSTGQDRLARLVADGLLAKEHVLLEGKIRLVYRRVQGDEIQED